MSSTFDKICKLYDNGQLAELVHTPDGLYWLKLRSLSRIEQLRRLCQRTGIHCEGIPGRQLLAQVYDHRPDPQVLENFIREQYQIERAERKANEDYLISQLYQMRVFDWGGLYQNSLEQTIVNNYVKKIRDWEKLNAAIENEIHSSMRGYVQCSWYNHWSSILIEDIFKDHPVVLPAVGLVKRVDFFVHDFPFDLKVTYFPDGYMELLRKRAGLRPELTELKAFCRQANLWFEQNKPIGQLFPELLAKVAEHPSQAARDFMFEFKAIRTRFIQQTLADPTPLKMWLYENQGTRRFDAAPRFFLILVDAEHLEESWKLKRNKPLLSDAIYTHLNTMTSQGMESLRLEFQWQNEVYTTYADTLFIVTGQGTSAR